MLTRITIAAAAAALLLPSAAGAQASAPPIADNSFLIEEAYNQEAGVVQHINTFARARGSSGWEYTFTQEWPVRDERHQLSYMVPVLRAGDDKVGVGDVMVNYRFQVPRLHPQLAISPRLSVELPTGNEETGHGRGSTAFEAALPVSYILSDRLVGHTNGGFSLAPSNDAPGGTTVSTMDTFIGQSLIWMPNNRINFMIEAVWGSEEFALANGVVARERSFVVSPGVRGAFNFDNGLQVVPGIAVPIGVGPSEGERGVFVYLSLEHAFKR